MKRCPSCNSACWASHRHCPSCGADVARVEVTGEDACLGATLAGKYRLTELLGVGATGRVYRADNLALDAQVAVKVLHAEFAADSQSAAAFQSEARAASRLRHPNAIAVVDFGQSEAGILYLVMELVRGRSLAQIIAAEAPLAPIRIADILGQALMALEESHAAGIVHCDFKSDNVMVETMRAGGEHAKVLDFGLAKLRGQAGGPRTRRATICGTPDYMSPEQARGEELDERADLYSAGVVLYEMICGVRPFASGRPVAETLAAQLREQPEPPSRRRPGLKVPRQLEALCLRLLSKDREQRPRGAAEVKTLLDAAVRELTSRRCRQCGAPLPDAARFCSQCGAVLGGAAAGRGGPGQPSPSPASLPALPLRLVGRAAEQARLANFSNGVLFLVGEAGMGKTRLAEDWARAHEEAGRRVVVGHADPSGAAVPLQPFRELVSRLLGLPDRPGFEEIDEALGAHRADRVGLAELFGLGGAASQLPLDVRRRECFSAVLGVVRRSGGPVVLEDVGLYDRPSRELVTRLIDDPGRALLLVTGTQADVLETGVEVVGVGPLSPEAMAELNLPDGIGALCGAVPFALELAIRALGENVPPGDMAARMAALPEAPRALLEAMVVTGVDVGSTGLAQLVQMADPGQALAELRARGFIRLGLRRMELASPTLRRVVYDAIDPGRRRALHARMAATLGARGGDAIVVAHHALKGDQPIAISTLEAAGDESRDGFDDGGAVRWYRAAARAERERGELARREAGSGARTAEPEGRTLSRIDLKLALVLRYSGDAVGSEEVLREALSEARRTGDRWSEVQALRGLARVSLSWRDLASARALLMDAVRVTLALGQVLLIADVYIELAEALRQLGDDDSARRELDEAILLCTMGEGAEGQEGPDSLWRLLVCRGEVDARLGDWTHAQTFGEQAIRHALRVQSPIGRARVNAFAGRVEHALGRFQQAAGYRRAAIEDLRRVGDRRASAELLLELADPIAVGAVDARAWLGEALDLATAVGWREGASRARAELISLAKRAVAASGPATTHKPEGT